MATVEQVMESSLALVLADTDDIPTEPEEISKFIFYFNNYMLALDAGGVQLGFTLIESINDQVTIPIGALRGTIANMGIEVAPIFAGQVTATLAQVAADGLKVMRLIGQSQGDSFFPGTLPRGSGNEFDGEWGTWSHFYPDQEALILAETTGSISLETNTNRVINDG